MAKTKVYQYKKCSTCVKALKFLSQKGIEFESLDITETPPSKKELQSMLKFYDNDLRRLFNTSGVQYRELKIKDKIKTMSTTEALNLLSKNGKLVKRPFLLHSNKGCVGFKEDEWSSLF